MSYARLAERLFNVPLLIAPDKADTIAAVFNAHLTNTQAEMPKYDAPERVDLASAMSMRRAEGGYYVTTAGVAVVQVHGSLVQRAGGLDALSGLTGYNGVAAMIGSAMRDHGVRGMVLEFDSPGGEVEGVVDLSTLIAGGDKPIWAHANGIALSAAYWLSAAADRVYASQTGLLGSIGVLMLHADRSKIIERAGVVYTPIYAGARKIDGSSMAPLTEEARARAQARVDQVYAMFVQHVASHRNVSEKKVRETEAAVLSVQDAKAVGLANGVASLGDTVQMMTDDLNAGRSKRKGYGRAAANAQFSQENHMEEGKGAAPNAPAAITQADVDKAVAQAREDERKKVAAEAEAKATKDATAKADSDAKARIDAILSCDEAKDRPTLAKHLALKTSTSLEDAKGLLAASAKETSGNPLDAAMRGRNPNIAPGATGGGEPAVVPIESADEIYARRQAQTLHAVK